MPTVSQFAQYSVRPTDSPGVRARARGLEGRREDAGLDALLGSDHVHDRVDQREVGECLREIAEVAPAPGVDLLGVELERTGVGEELLAEVACPIYLSDLGEGRDEPEGADRERSLFVREAVVGLLGAIA